MLPCGFAPPALSPARHQWMTCSTRHCVIEATKTQALWGQGPGHSPLCSANSQKKSSLLVLSWEEAKTLLLTLQPSAGHQSATDCPLHPHPPMHQQPPQTGETRDIASTACSAHLPAPRAPNSRSQKLPLPQCTASISQHIPQPSLHPSRHVP